jgi:hypothetical protein
MACKGKESLVDLFHYLASWALDTMHIALPHYNPDSISQFVI